MGVLSATLPAGQLLVSAVERFLKIRMMIPISVGKWRWVSNECELSRSEDRGGGGREGEEGQDKNAGRNDPRGREDPGGGSVSSHRHTGNSDSLIIIDYQAKMTLIITIT